MSIKTNFKLPLIDEEFDITDYKQRNIAVIKRLLHIIYYGETEDTQLRAIDLLLRIGAL